jgi:hypothetical protein
MVVPDLNKRYMGYCDDNSKCNEDKLNYALSYFKNDADFKTLIIIGVAKDGRAIYGPYKADGTLWQPCEVDMCNGAIVNGKYSYVSTLFYPYFVGCWGPSNDGNLSPTCTSKPRTCDPTSLTGTSLKMMIALSFISVILYMF